MAAYGALFVVLLLLLSLFYLAFSSEYAWDISRLNEEIRNVAGGGRQVGGLITMPIMRKHI